MADAKKTDLKIEPVLSEGDLQDPIWRVKIEPFLKKHLEILRNELEADAPPEKTARIRGAIREVRRFLKLGTPIKFEDSEPPPY